MRLVQIKLAGFKSFVDPTTIKIPGQMIGVVGPNGCGKSNIIDAVRWVLGESRASELRGDSMHDVIFNGSAQRAPSARASVELIFDNNGQRVSGQWGAYSELAVRRTLARDEGSRYYINNQQVRRRDIYDIFMGTGLGSRGYAIIGQGMINRLIEARPEELRVYLEEAAGVSRYKERRRETENRLRDAQENLSRLEDLLHEIEQQLQRLNRQAAQAQRYQELQAQGLQVQHALWRLEQKQAATTRQAQAQELEQLELRLQKQLAELRHLQAQAEQQRSRHEEAAEAVQAAQGALYEANSRVSTAQAELRYVQANQERSVKRRGQIEQQLEHWQQQQAQAAEQMQTLTQEYEYSSACLEEAQAQAEQADLNLEALEHELQQASQQRDELRQQLHRDEQEMALLQQRQEDAQTRIVQLQQRATELGAQHGALQTDGDEEDLTALQGALQHAKAQLQKVQEQLLHWEAQAPKLQQQLATTEQQWHEQKARSTALSERMQALEDIQQQWASPAQLQQWLQEQQLDTVPRLWPLLRVQEDWEVALEAVLREQIGAFLLNDELAHWLMNIDRHPPRRIHLWKIGRGAVQPPQSWQGCAPLIQYVQCQQAGVQTVLNDLLAQVWVVQDWQQALALAPQLPQGGCLVHPQGHIFYPTGMSFYAPDDEQAGGVARQQEILQLRQQIRQEALYQEQLDTELEQHRQAVGQAEGKLQQLRHRVHELSTYIHEQELRYTQAKQRQQQQEERRQFVRAEQAQIAEHIQALEHEQHQRDEQLSVLEAVVEQQRGRFGEADDRSVQLGEQVSMLRQQLREFERATHDWQQKASTLRERMSALEQRQGQASTQQQALEQEHEQLQNELISFDTQSVQKALDTALVERQQSEQHWQAAQAQQQAQQAQLQALLEKERQCAQEIEPLRAQIASLQLKEQEGRLKAEQFEQHLQAHEVDVAALDQFIAEQSAHWQDKTWLNDETGRIQRAIKAMGAVNLAALQELEAAQERQKYLLAQQDDLLTAIDTLESAIHKIDRQTRTLLRETFEQVDENFGVLFPQLFGGGEARLVMEGEEILEAGVQVMARPPGKRNTTIALLSGGEKALTATALVFAFFKLNPAPFCLLDEVDAPLDDANAERYAQLVQGMSDNTQFLFVTHNKITMQKAEQLVGVTMQEQGVSRIVSVDMQAAAELADA